MAWMILQTELVKRHWVPLACLALLLAATASPLSAIVVDDFSIDDKPLLGEGTFATSGSNSIGNSIDIVLERLEGDDDIVVFFSPITGLRFAVDPEGLFDGAGDPVATSDVEDLEKGATTRARVTLTWDGDLNSSTFDPVGLGGVDFTADGSGFKLSVGQATAGIGVVMEVYTDAGNASFATLILPGVAVSTDFFFSYSQFSPFIGTGADFTDVGAIRLKFQGSGPGEVFATLLETAGPEVEATMTDLMLNDSDIGATVVGPGAQIKYRIVVTNTGGDALGLALEIDTGIDANATVDSVQTQPIAVDDTYRGFGNVTLDVAAGSGTLQNDVDADLDVPRVNIANSSATSTAGGTITWNDIGAGLGDGAFTYLPTVGFEGIDTFTYEAIDDDGRTDTATVSVVIDSTIWFVDNTDGGADAGTQADPFQSISTANLNGASGVGDLDGPGDIIYFFTGTGTYSGGLELEDDQRVLGPEDGLVVDGVVLIPDTDDARPTITAAVGNGIDLGFNNMISGLNVGNTAGVGIAGLEFGTATISKVAVSGAGGALSFNSGTLAAVFDSVASTSGTLGIEFSGVNGSFTVAGTTTIDATAGDAIRVLTGGGTYNFGATSIGQTSTVDQGVILSATGGATTDFASLAATADSGLAFSATNAGIVRVAGAANTLTSTAGGALALNTVNFDGVFATVNASGGAGDGIRLEAVTDANGVAPALVVTSATIDGFAGSGIEIVGTAGVVQINGGTMNNVGTGGDAALRVNSGAGDVVVATSLTANANGRSVDIQGRSGGTVSVRGAINDNGDGIFITANPGGAIEFRGGMQLNTGANTAFSATANAGTITVCATDDCAAGGAVVNRIGNTTALSKTAVEIANSTIGAAGVTFQSIDVNEGATGSDVPAIILTSTGAGPFSVTGTGSTAGSGGTIQDIIDSDGIRLSDTGGRVTLRNMVIEDIGDSSDASDGIGTGSGVDGIHGQMVTGGLTIRGTTMRRFSDNAILGASFAGGTATTFVGLEIRDSTFQDSNRYHVGPEGPTGLGDDSAEGMVRILGASGTVLVQDSTFERGAQLLDILTASSGLLTMTVQSSNFNRTIKEFRCAPPGTVNIGKAGISVRTTGSTDVDLFIGDPAQANPALGNTFLDNATASVVVLHDDPGASGEIDTVISRNTFRVIDHLTGPAGCPAGSFQFNAAQGGVFLGPGAGDFEGIVSNNLFDQLQAANGGIGQLSVTFDDGGDAELIVRGNTFQLPWDASVRLLADGNNTASVLFGGPGVGEANTYVDGTVGGPGDDVGGPTSSPFNPWSANVRNGGRLDLRIDNEVLPQHDDVFSAFNNSFDASINASGGTFNLHITESVSPDGYRFDLSGGALNLFNEGNVGGCPRTAAQILDDNANTGGSNSDATDPPVVVGAGVICSTTPPTSPAIVIP